MKRNIDLTEKRDFSLGENDRSLFEALSFLRTNPKVPWSTIYKELLPIRVGEEDLQHNSLFPVGSVLEIKQYKEVRHYEEGARCDRCGIKLKLSCFGERLCKSCSKLLYQDFKGFGNWKKQSEMIPQDFLAQYLNIRNAKR